MSTNLRTADRATDIMTADRIGRTQELTPEGYLLCRDVRVARTGLMLYAPDEIGLEGDSDGVVRVTRGPEDLFRPETIMSFNGKPVVDDHPDEDVTPDNWRDHAGGFGLNVRRGTGEDDEFLVAELLIMDKDIIKAVQDGKREISLGYDADYEQTDPGRGRQFNIIGNHFALVDQGRCGPRCAIGDAAMRTTDKPSGKKRTWIDRLMTGVKARDEEAIREALEGAPKEVRDEMTQGGPEGGDGEGAGVEGGGAQNHVITIRHEVPGMPGKGAETAAVSDDNADPDAGADPDAAADPANAPPPWFKAFSNDFGAFKTSIEGRLAALEGGGDEGKVGEEGEGGGEETMDEERPFGEKDPLPESGTMDDADPDFGAKDPLPDPGEMKDGSGTQDDYGVGKDWPATKDGKTRDAKTVDSRTLKGLFQDTIARAEILCPGIRIPTFDAKLNAATTLDRVCALRRRALAGAIENPETRKLLAPLVGRDPDMRKVTCDALKPMFVGGSELMRIANSGAPSTRFVHDHQAAADPASISSINDRNREFWKKQGAHL